MSTPPLERAEATALAAPMPAGAARTKPKLRGVSHELAALVAIPATFLLVQRARSTTALVGALVYGATLVTLFSVSALYHRRFWPLRTRQIVGRLDHSAIFLLIAGTYTPLGLLIGPGAGHLALWAVWAGAVAGIGLVLWWDGLTKRRRALVYVLLGWVVLPVLPQLRSAVGDAALGLLFLGGGCYTLGAFIYGARRPDPFPRVFGFHEIFHLLVIAAAACHYLVVHAAVQALG